VAVIVDQQQEGAAWDLKTRFVLSIQIKVRTQLRLMKSWGWQFDLRCYEQCAANLRASAEIECVNFHQSGKMQALCTNGTGPG
jgi:hypothetical protein